VTSTPRPLTRFAWLSIGAATATIALKAVAFALTGSVGLLSDALESGVNLVAAIVAPVALSVAARPADEQHYYGHSKAEYFSAGWAWGAQLSRARRSLESVHDLMQGVPTAHFLPSAYWRKRTSPAPDCDLDRDRCGLIWCSFVAPIDGALTQEMTAVAADVLLAHGFEPGMTLTLVNERALDNVVSVSYDRDDPGADQRALACRDALYRRLMGLGIYPYRLDVRAAELMPPGNPDYRSFLEDLKRIADPEGVLAPGRYEF
jgi:hypothetical protein